MSAISLNKLQSSEAIIAASRKRHQREKLEGMLKAGKPGGIFFGVARKESRKLIAEFVSHHKKLPCNQPFFKDSENKRIREAA